MGTLTIEFTTADQFDLLRFWNDMPEKVRRVMFWDTDTTDKQDALQAFQKASLPLLVARSAKGQAIGFAWLVSLRPESDASFIHFCFDTGKADQRTCLAAGKLALQKIAEAGIARMLLAYFPVQYRHAHTFALALGFSEMGKPVRGLARLAGNAHNSDFILMQRDLEKGIDA